MSLPTCIDMFTGIGGLAVLLPVKPVLYVEKCTFALDVLRRRMANNNLMDAAICDDVRYVPHVANVDYIVAGFPCQSLSSIGQRAGLSVDSGTPSSLFHCIIDVAVKMRVPHLFLENVEGLLQRRVHWEVVLVSLHSAGYNVAWTTVGACHCGAPHRRLRWFALCHLRRDTTAAKSPRIDPKLQSLHRSGLMVDGVLQCKPWSRPSVCGSPVLIHLPFGRRLRRWATPRARSFYAAARHLLTSARCRVYSDLGTQARYAHSTSLRQRRRGYMLNPEWLEWLMGFPPGWSNPEVSHVTEPVISGAWAVEADVPRLLCREDLDKPAVRLARRRNTALGNACVPQCSLQAWTVLHNMMLNI